MILEVIAVELDDPEALAILHLMAQIAEAEEAPAEILSLGFSVIPVDRAGIWRLGSRRFLPQPPSDLRFHLIG
ncbi:hypothetical protein RchiOBHm_Chr2g0173341 [Rosa chinensis]|uniref:Uncharacterized protein n=1 Tax=Rosa chinensis TaxID=74649 RepID=A0A2P6S5V5_ROSCH|nr:hypothetical protein RchiOBHm_Chr2g0173341 [Rosa chinensis]